MGMLQDQVASLRCYCMALHQEERENIQKRVMSTRYNIMSSWVTKVVRM